MRILKVDCVVLRLRSFANFLRNFWKCLWYKCSWILDHPGEEQDTQLSGLFLSCSALC